MTKREKELVKVMVDIYDCADDFLGYVYSTNNQCAATDRKVEKIIELAKTLEEKYKEVL